MMKNIFLKIPLNLLFIFTCYAANHSVYDETNRFWQILQNPLVNADTKIFANTNYTLAFEDNHKETKEHILFIPKGKYTSFVDFADKASPEEIEDFFKTISQVAEKLSLNTTGYRLITNHSLAPGGKINNDAEQKIAHFHVHMAGGECLGLPVAGATKTEELRTEIDMSISHPPFGFDLPSEEFLRYVSKNILSELIFHDYVNGLRKIIAYTLPSQELHLKKYIGFVLLNASGESAYPTIQSFSQHGTQTELVTMLKFMSDIAKKTSLYKTGFRLIINHGKDAWQYPKDILQITIAGGAKMGKTVTNVYGNRKPKTKDEPGNIAYSYDDLKSLPHENCSAKK